MAKGNAFSIGNGPKYPQVKVPVTGPDGGFYGTVAAVQAAMRRAGVPLRELSNFYVEPRKVTLRRVTRTTSCGPACDGWMSISDE